MIVIEITDRTRNKKTSDGNSRIDNTENESIAGVLRFQKLIIFKIKSFECSIIRTGQKCRVIGQGKSSYDVVMIT